MSTLLAMETRQHADASPLPRTTGDIHPCFGGKGRFEYPGNSERFSRVVESLTPYGDLGQMFQATLGASYRVTHLPVQSNKNYRFSIWVKRNAHTAVASPQQACVMFGIDGNKVTTLDGNGSSDGWASGWALTPPFNEWCLMVVYLHSHRSFRTLSTGGCYHPSGRVMMSFCDFKQVVGTTEQELRFGLHTKQMQLGNAQSAYFFYPRVDEITGSEVSIAELLRGYGYNLFVREFDLHNGEHCDDDPELALTIDTLAEHSVTALKDVEDAGSGNIITSLERHQLNVALDKLCELDTRLERYVTIEQVNGEINPIPDTLVKRSVNSEIFATIMRAELVEAEALVSTSDRRLKKNIKDDTLGLAFIEMLRPVRYHKMKVLHEEEAQTPTNEGEGDSRWIVQERDDGVNVNGWHWQERNMMGWGKDRMSQLLTAITFELPGSEGAARVVEISKFEGDASVNTRKGNKKFAVFDLSVTCKWEGECVDAEGKETTAKGEIKLTEFASENDEDEYVFKVTSSDGDKAAKERLKQKIEAAVAAAFAPCLATFAKELADM